MTAEPVVNKGATGLHGDGRARILGAVTIGKNIERLRREAGFKTQTAFANHLKVKQSRVADWESDRYASPDLKSLMTIAKGLRVGLDVIVNGFDAEYDSLVADQSRHTAVGKSRGLHKRGALDDATVASAGPFAELAALSADVAKIAGRLAELAGRPPAARQVPRDKGKAS